MPEVSALARKLLLKAGMSVLPIGAPAGYEEALAPLPEGVSLSRVADGEYDCVQLFAESSGELAAGVEKSLAALKPGGLFWVAFPKGTSRVQTDLGRDHGWQPVERLGWRLVSLISIDDTWSGARVRPVG